MEKLNRHSIRLKGYDYSNDGLYFITICTQERLHLFGEIENVPLVGAGFARPSVSAEVSTHPKMILNLHGRIIEQCYLHLEQKYPYVHCHDYVVMPNHFHAVIAIDRGISCNVDGLRADGQMEKQWAGKPRPYASLGQIVGYFKYLSTKLVDLKNQKLWQRNYYEHIIRTQLSFDNIIEYIRNNPNKWENDCFYVNDGVQTE